MEIVFWQIKDEFQMWLKPEYEPPQPATGVTMETLKAMMAEHVGLPRELVEQSDMSSAHTFRASEARFNRARAAAVRFNVPILMGQQNGG